MFIFNGPPQSGKPSRKLGAANVATIQSLSEYAVEQAISALKAGIIKQIDIFRPEMQAQMNARDEDTIQGVALGEYRQQLLLAPCLRNIGTITTQICSMV